jgi:hypothetical protein
LPALQSSSVPHEAMHAAALPLQNVRVHSLPGSIRLGTLAQVPTAPTRLQAWHVPAQAVLQHTPSTQLPEAHWSGDAQSRPWPFFAAHAPSSQK